MQLQSWGCASEKTTLLSCLEMEEKNKGLNQRLSFAFLSCAGLCFVLWLCFPPRAIRSSPQRTLAAVPALEASCSYCVCTDGQTNRLRARGARGSPWPSPARLGLGGDVLSHPFSHRSPGSRTAGKRDVLQQENRKRCWWQEFVSFSISRPGAGPRLVASRCRRPGLEQPCAMQSLSSLLS